MYQITIYSRIRSNLISWQVIIGLCSQMVVITPVQAAQLPQEKSGVASSTVLSGCHLFPANNIWNTPVDNLPSHTRSDQWINSIGRNTGFHMDFGSGTWNGGPIGIPYNIVGGSTPKVPVSFYYPDESDPGPYPIPTNPLIEYGSDHHILVLDNSTCTLYELYDANYSGGSWHAGSGAIWSMNSNALRPDTWTSADAAGLPILPGLVRYDEIISGEINHAIRFTAETTNRYIWPARHLTSNNQNTLYIPPMGARFRLKSSFNISSYPPAMQVILTAMKTYGIILADNGSNWYVSGVPDSRWDNDMLHLLDNLTGNDFEAVDTAALMVTYDSGATQPINTPANVQVLIAGGNQESYSLSPYTSIRSSYSGVDNGPVKVTSTNWIPIVASERVAYSPDGGTTWTSHSELMGLPANLVHTSYTFPFYNNIDLNSQLRFGNVGTASTTVTVIIGGQNKGNFTLAANASRRISYAGLNAGPVVVRSNGQPIIASLRVAYTPDAGVTWTSFSEMMGLPSNKLTNRYIFPFYNNLDLNSQLRFGNVGTVGTTVTVTIGGQVRGTYVLGPNQSQRVSYSGLNAGPVKVTSSGNVPIIASLRVAYHDGTAWTDFSEMMGLPASSLSTHYSFPAYDNVHHNSQLRFGNVGTSSTAVAVIINGVLQGTYNLAPNASQRISYAGLDSGPVVIQSLGGVPIIASLRVAYTPDGGVTWTSFAEMMGLPQSQLTTSYVFPWYNNLDLDTQLRVGIP